MPTIRRKFRKGQVWKDHLGRSWTIRNISNKAGDKYPIIVTYRSTINYLTSTGHEYDFFSSLMLVTLERDTWLNQKLDSLPDLLWDFREWAWGSSRPTSKIRIVSIGPVTLVWHREK